MAEAKKEAGKKAAVKKKVTAGKKRAAKKKTPMGEDVPATDVVAEEKKVVQAGEGQTVREPPDTETTHRETPNQQTRPGSAEVLSNRERAAASRKALLNQMRSDFRTGKNTLWAAGSAAKKDLKLLKAFADNEYALAKEQVSTAWDREDSLLGVGQRQARKVLLTGGRWGKQQLKKIKNTADKLRNKSSQK